MSLHNVCWANNRQEVAASHRTGEQWGRNTRWVWDIVVKDISWRQAYCFFFQFFSWGPATQPLCNTRVEWSTGVRRGELAKRRQLFLLSSAPSRLLRLTSLPGDSQHWTTTQNKRYWKPNKIQGKGWKTPPTFFDRQERMGECIFWERKNQGVHSYCFG